MGVLSGGVKLVEKRTDKKGEERSAEERSRDRRGGVDHKWRGEERR